MTAKSLVVVVVLCLCPMPSAQSQWLRRSKRLLLMQPIVEWTGTQTTDPEESHYLLACFQSCNNGTDNTQ